MKTLAFDAVGSCLVLAVDTKIPGEADWALYLAFVEIQTAQGKPLAILISSRGGVPTPAQRQRLVEKSKGAKVAVLTASSAAHVAKELNEPNQTFKPFAPSDVEAALSFLGVAAPQQPELKLLVAKVHDKIGADTVDTKTLAFDRVGPCFILAVGERKPSDIDWDTYLAFVKSEVQRSPALLSSGKIVALVSSKGGGPTSEQRERLNGVTRSFGLEKRLKVAVLTWSSVVRGITAALSAIVPGYKTFSPMDMDAALSFLDLAGSDRKEVERRVTLLHGKIDERSAAG